MIVSYNNTNQAWGLRNTVSSTVLSMGVQLTPTTLVSEKIGFDDLVYQSPVITMLKQNAADITSKLKVPLNTSVEFADREIEMKVTSCDFTVELYPAVITLDNTYVVQSKFNLYKNAVDTLHMYSLQMRELKYVETILAQGTEYLCKFGTQANIPTEATEKDLREISARLKAAGMVPMFRQFIASTAINTSGVPKAYCAIGSCSDINTLLEDLDAYNNNSFTPSYQYSGSINYAFNCAGVHAPSGIAFISSNNFNAGTKPEQYILAILATDSFYVGEATPVKDGIFKTSGAPYSPINTITKIATRTVTMSKVVREEGVIIVKASKKTA